MMAEKPFQIKIDDDILQKIIKQVADQDVKERIIHDGVEYGVFQEFSIGGRGHPSLMPAFERHTKDLPKLVGQAIERAIPLDKIMAKIAFDIMRDWAADVNVDTGAYQNSIMVK
jgi:Ribonuclease G/E